MKLVHANSKLGKLTPFFFFLFIGIQLSMAQSSISGQVVDDSNVGLPGANIIVKGTTVGTSADIDGNFELSTSLAFPLDIDVSFVGYLTKSLTIQQPTTNLVIALVTLPGNDVVVSVSRKQEMVQIAPASVSLLTERKLRSDAVIEPMLSLRNLPGVDIAQYSVGGGQINLRGKSGVFQTETFIIADYRNIVIPSLGFLVFGQHPIDMLDLERIEVVKGPASALYGPGVEAGIVHFISKDPFRYPGTSVSIGAGNRSQFTTSFRHADIVSDKLAYKITGQYRSARDFELDPNDPNHAERLAGYRTPIVSAITGEPIDAVVPDYDQKSYGVTATLAYRPNENTTLYAVGGYGVYEGLFRTSQGEGYVASGRPFAQLRLNSGNLFAQVFWSKINSKDGEAFLYNTGLTTITISDQFESQLQYNFDLENEKIDLTVGGDFRMVNIDTKNTIHGRLEDDDDYTILGIYVQGRYAITDKLEAIAAARVDQFSALDETSFSPRLGLSYQPSSSSTFRLTWNKAFGAPASLNLFGDTPIDDNGSFMIYLLNGKETLSFNNNLGYNFITQTTTEGGNIPLASIYGLVTSGLASSGQFPQGLIDYLFSITPNFNGDTNAVPTGAPVTRSPLTLSESDMFELGYKGIINNRWAINADIYYIRRKNILSAPLPIAPFLIYPTAGNDLGASVIANTDPDVLAQYGFTPESLAGVYSGSIEAFTLDENGAPTALGLLKSDNSPPDLGTYDFAFLNFDKIDYWGIDVGVEYFVNDDLSIFGNLTWLSKIYWEELSIANSDLTAPLSLNTPDKRFKLGVNFYPEKGFYYNAALRLSADWESVDGFAFSGPVDGYVVADAGIGYKFDNLQLGFTVTNLFDEKYRPIFAAPDIRRLILAKAVYEF
jgi:iron complex outermembrane receptor protein